MPTRPPEPTREPALAIDFRLPGTRRFCVGFSGGLDSTALLQRLAQEPDIAVRALHVHHGLQADADAWADHCTAVCARLGVPLTIAHVTVTPQGDGLEAAARRARHAAFAAQLAADEVLVLAQHRDDQAETFLLHALRGSGVDGLAAMPAWRAYAQGWLWRPLLDTARDDILAYAQHHGLAWIDDPSNADTTLDRNYLRHVVLPRLHERWPHAAAALARSAALQRETQAVLATQDEEALSSLLDDADTLAIAPLLQLSTVQRARVLRAWIAARGLPPLPANGVAQLQALCLARADGDARFDWADTSVFGWRGRLHALPRPRALPLDYDILWDGRTPLQLPTGDVLTWTGAPFVPALQVRARRGGERLHLPQRAHSHALKKLLQDRDVPPWLRQRLPLLFSADGVLLAVGDHLLAKDWPGGGQLHWTLA